ncbi:MAG: DUF4352 domain-containing protein [Chloroflexi bacterium]|nr:DUF4352 domain-containing protein [Chloroflexota bacterium]
MAPANTPATGQTPATLGISITLDNLMYLPTTAERVDQIGTDKAQADHQFVLITVTVGNTSQKETLKFDPATFILTSTKSITNYTPVSLKSLKDELKEQELKPGAESKGVIVFTVPKSDTNLELMVKGSTGHQVMWTLTNTKVGAVMQRHSG